MIYTEREKLTIIDLKEEKEEISFEEIGKVLQERPANIIYCELNGTLYGVVSAGDIRRANMDNKREVSINKKFTSVRYGEYMMARQIFMEKKGINSLPVVDNGGCLRGGTRVGMICFG